MNQQITNGICVTVSCRYLKEHSVPEGNGYVWAYDIDIKNQNDHMVQLLFRHWIIADANGMDEHVKGPGVVGLQPLIAANETFSYSSFCVLKTPSGKMHGTYEMQTLAREKFNVVIPEFFLLSHDSHVNYHLH